MKAMILGLATVATLLGACQPAALPPASIAFSAQEAGFIRKPGTGTITGHAFRTKANGAVVNAAGQVVRLVPATAYARERFRQIYGTRKFVAQRAYPDTRAVDPAYVEHTRTTKADARGRFAFDKVAPGTYLVTTEVVWGEENALFREGGSVYDEVTLTGRETEPVDLVLSGN